MFQKKCPLRNDDITAFVSFLTFIVDLLTTAVQVYSPYNQKVKWNKVEPSYTLGHLLVEGCIFSRKPIIKSAHGKCMIRIEWKQLKLQLVGQNSINQSRATQATNTRHSKILLPNRGRSCRRKKCLHFR